MKEICVPIKVDDDFEYGNCQNCRFSKDSKYAGYYDRVLYKCRLYSGIGEWIINKEDCLLK